MDEQATTGATGPEFNKEALKLMLDANLCMSQAAKCDADGKKSLAKLWRESGRAAAVAAGLALGREGAPAWADRLIDLNAALNDACRRMQAAAEGGCLDEADRQGAIVERLQEERDALMEVVQ